ncbi:MAG: hypothetical protein E6Q66_09940 [Pedobacter sp.]|jgi:hypothetical protein|nr:MAG: hypothetical protein E6Q66_09940 [Pedobacter sp.]
MKTKLILYLLILLLLICSCRTIKPIQQSKTIIKETLRDTVVNIPTDRSSFQAKLDINDAGNPVIKEVLHTQNGKRALIPKVQIKDQVLQVDCLCDSMAIYLKLKDTHITDMLHETVFVPTEKPLSMWQQTQLWMGRALLILLAGAITILVITRKIV